MTPVNNDLDLLDSALSELLSFVVSDGEVKKPGHDISYSWTCPFCGAISMIKSVDNAARHMVYCPNNPYK